MRLRAWWGVLLAASSLAAPAVAGDVNGRITLGVEGARLADLGPTVVFLDGERGRIDFPPPRGRAAIHQRKAQFDPDFLVVTVNQPVEMPNDDTIFHNVFSFSRPNVFDLGLYPSGESRTVRFAYPGLVRLYCSIHESMNGSVLVAPSPYHAVATASGEYRIRDVPPGTYRLRVWNEKLPETQRVVRLGAADERVDVTLGDAEAAGTKVGDARP